MAIVAKTNTAINIVRLFIPVEKYFFVFTFQYWTLLKIIFSIKKSITAPFFG
jgi:hypothetical protein